MAADKAAALQNFLSVNQRPSAPAAAPAAPATRRKKGRAKSPAAAVAASGSPATAAAAASSGRRALADGREQVLVYLQPDGIRELKLAVLDRQATSVSAIVAEAVNAWLVAHDRPPVA